MSNPLDKIMGTETKLIIIPAYGRTYNTRNELIDAWNAGNDFKIVNGPYISIRDFEIMKKEYDHAMIQDLRSTLYFELF